MYAMAHKFGVSNIFNDFFLINKREFRECNKEKIVDIEIIFKRTKQKKTEIGGK